LVGGLTRAEFPATRTQARPSDKRGYARLHIDSQITAKRQRHVKNAAQLGWDREIDAVYMMKCAGGEHGLASVIPLARVMERMKIILAGRCGSFERVSQNMSQRALHSAARCFIQGDLEWAIRLMAPIHSLIVRRPGPEAMQEVLATFIRDLFPAPPSSYLPPQARVGHEPKPVREPTKQQKTAQAQRRATIQKAPDLDKVRQMSPERARLMLPIMVDALQGYDGDDRLQFEEAIFIMQERGEIP
jgi:hypothetical protein